MKKWIQIIEDDSKCTYNLDYIWEINSKNLNISEFDKPYGIIFYNGRIEDSKEIFFVNSQVRDDIYNDLMVFIISKKDNHLIDMTLYE